MSNDTSTSNTAKFVDELLMHQQKSRQCEASDIRSNMKNGSPVLDYSISADSIPSSGRFVPATIVNETEGAIQINYQNSTKSNNTSLTPTKTIQRSKKNHIVDQLGTVSVDGANVACCSSVNATAHWRPIKPSTEKPRCTKKLIPNDVKTGNDQLMAASITNAATKRRYNRKSSKLISRQNDILDAARTLVLANQLGHYHQPFDVNQQINVNSNAQLQDHQPIMQQRESSNKSNDIITSTPGCAAQSLVTLAQPQLIFRTTTAATTNQHAISSSQMQHSIQRQPLAFNCSPQVFQYGTNGASFQLVPVGSSPFQFINCPNSSQLLLAHTHSYEELYQQTSNNRNNRPPSMLNNHTSSIINRVAHCSEDSSVTSKSLPNSDDSFDSCHTNSSHRSAKQAVADKEDLVMPFCGGDDATDDVSCPPSNQDLHVQESNDLNVSTKTAASNASQIVKSTRSSVSRNAPSRNGTTLHNDCSPAPTISINSNHSHRVEDDIVTHVVDGFVIKESSVPFPVIQYCSSNIARKDSVNNQVENSVDETVPILNTARGRNKSLKIGTDKRRTARKNHTKRDKSKINDNTEIDQVDKHCMLRAKRSRRASSNGVTHEKISSPSSANVSDTKVALNEDPDTWTIDDVSNFILERTSSSELAEKFRLHEVDGSALLLVKEEFLMQFMDMKLGPALKLCSRIADLKKRSSLCSPNITIS